MRLFIAGVALALPVVLAQQAQQQAPLQDLDVPDSVTTTALPFPSTPAEHWTPSDRPDPFVCEYLGENNCWQPSHPGGGAPYSHDGEWSKRSKTCVVKACGKPDGDDAPAILAAFDECKSDGHIVFENTTYYVRTVMNTTGLQHVDIEVNGTLLWSDDIEYWLGASLPFGFQNQTSAWHVGGEDIHFYGHGVGTLDGNGQVWYDCKWQNLSLGDKRFGTGYCERRPNLSHFVCPLRAFRECRLILLLREPGQVEYAWPTSRHHDNGFERVRGRRSSLRAIPNVDHDRDPIGAHAAPRHLRE
jgi:hypothetical protein